MMLADTLRPTWLTLPRPYHFPQNFELRRLLQTNFDPALGGFSLAIKRRGARALRKGLFGPKGCLDVPGNSGVMVFDLPNGWTLRLTYYAAGEYDPELGLFTAGDVDAEFIPPTRRPDHPSIPNGHSTSSEEARL
jgi:hypothetical protein